MKAKALRGVCIGVDRHLKPGETAELDAAQFKFLEGIGAVVEARDEPAPAAPKPQAPAPRKE